MFYNQGQVCSAGSRLIVEEKIKDKLIEKIAVIGEQIIIGNPQDPTTQLGAVISEEQLERIMDFIEIGIPEGANLD